MIDRGWYGMACWNALSTEQQLLLLTAGVLPFGRWEPEGGTCTNPAELSIETQYDEAPGPRFYCRRCAIEFLDAVQLSPRARRARARARGRS